MRFDIDLRDFRGGASDDQLPLIRVYCCLYCGRYFSIKRQLKLHYLEVHAQSIPNYQGV